MNRGTQNHPLFNLVKLEGLANGDTSAIKHFNRVFLDVTIAQDLPKLESLYDSADFDALAKHAHKMKSSIELYSIDSIAPVIRMIEKAAREQEDLGTMKSWIQTV